MFQANDQVLGALALNKSFLFTELSLKYNMNISKKVTILSKILWKLVIQRLKLPKLILTELFLGTFQVVVFIDFIFRGNDTKCNI